MHVMACNAKANWHPLVGRGSPHLASERQAATTRCRTLKPLHCNTMARTEALACQQAQRVRHAANTTDLRTCDEWLVASCGGGGEMGPGGRGGGEWRGKGRRGQRMEMRLSVGRRGCRAPTGPGDAMARVAGMGALGLSNTTHQ